MAQQRFQTFDASETYFAEGGKYLPLNVWRQQGFDTELIKSQTLQEDIYNDDVLGVCYRLRIREKKQNYREGVRKNDTVEAADAEQAGTLSSVLELLRGLAQKEQASGNAKPSEADALRNIPNGQSQYVASASDGALGGASTGIPNIGGQSQGSASHGAVGGASSGIPNIGGQSQG